MPSITDSHAALSEQLKARDVRPTPQREVVLKVILEKRDHPTADEIFARVKASMPTISLAQALPSGRLSGCKPSNSLENISNDWSWPVYSILGR